MLNKKDIEKSYHTDVYGNGEISITVGNNILLNITRDGKRFWIPGGYFYKKKLSNEVILKRRLKPTQKFTKPSKRKGV